MHLYHKNLSMREYNNPRGSEGVSSPQHTLLVHSGHAGQAAVNRCPGKAERISEVRAVSPASKGIHGVIDSVLHEVSG